MYRVGLSTASRASPLTVVAVRILVWLQAIINPAMSGMYQMQAMQQLQQLQQLRQMQQIQLQQQPQPQQLTLPPRHPALGSLIPQTQLPLPGMALPGTGTGAAAGGLGAAAILAQAQANVSDTAATAHPICKSHCICSLDTSDL